jgi:hypothetical protein
MTALQPDAPPAPSTPVHHGLTPAQRVKSAVKGVLGLRGERSVRILAGPARGVRMTLDFAGHTPMYLGMFEWELHEFFTRSLRGARLVFDVGGYLGYDALMFAANCDGRVVTFEPNAAQARLLEANVEQNPSLSHRITINRRFVAAAPGDDATTIDEVAGESPPDVIKIDIDGGEADALRGAERTLAGRRPHVVVETHSLELERECGRLLADHGYRPVIKHNRRVWREHRGGAAHNRWLLAEGRPTPR